MTVKCLTKDEQQDIVTWYKNSSMPINEFAYIYGVSPRTITRVLLSANVVTPLAKRSGDSYRVMQILNKHDVTIDELGTLLVLGISRKNEIEEDHGYPLEEFEDIPF